MVDGGAAAELVHGIDDVVEDGEREVGDGVVVGGVLAGDGVGLDVGGRGMDKLVDGVGIVVGDVVLVVS